LRVLELVLLFVGMPALFTWVAPPRLLVPTLILTALAAWTLFHGEAAAGATP
jgi:hypothetical protein